MRGALAMLCVFVATTLAPSADAAGARSRKGSPITKPSRGAKAGSRDGTRAKSSKKRRPGKSRTPRVAEREDRAAERDDEARRAPSRRAHAGALTPLTRAIGCPSDMVAVAGRVCVDRFETHLVDVRSNAAWSPFYPPSVERARTIAAFYGELQGKEREPWLGALLRIPPAPTERGVLRASSEAGVLPQGYLTADEAEGACRSAGKRLCSESEWLTACRGDTRTDFPYGPTYEQGACNVYRESHPTWLLHGNAARYHDDPRSNAVATDAGPLLRTTGSTPRCASRWGDDAIYDLVGNLDEWVADEQGVFAGGFYARPTKSGCFARVSNHPRTYSDYSTGARCCKDPDVSG